MATEYNVEISVTLRPVGQPWVKVSAGPIHKTLQLNQATEIQFDFDYSENFVLAVEHFGKPDLDPDTAVEITDVKIFGISDPKFAWKGTYWPNYPEHLSGSNASIPAQTYLSWNGVYKLSVSVPVFTWIHRTLDMGWIYD